MGKQLMHRWWVSLLLVVKLPDVTDVSDCIHSPLCTYKYKVPDSKQKRCFIIASCFNGDPLMESLPGNDLVNSVNSLSSVIVLASCAV